MAQRFLQLPDVCEVLNISSSAPKESPWLSPDPTGCLGADARPTAPKASMETRRPSTPTTSSSGHRPGSCHIDDPDEAPSGVER